MSSSPTNLIETITPLRTNRRSRFALLWLLMWISLGALLTRSFYLQALQGANFRLAAERNRVGIQIIPAPRGIIYDRNQVQLTTNVSSTDLVADPALLPTTENEAYLVDNLVQILPALRPQVIQLAITKARQIRQPVTIIKAIDHQTVLKLEEAGDKITGTSLVSSLVRQYSYPQAAAHVLGYTSAVTVEDLEADASLYPTDSTGKTGIEKQYDLDLRGQAGQALNEVNAAGQPQTDLGQREPVAGQDIQLTIDIRLQNFIYSLLSEQDDKRQQAGKKSLAGAVVALDPRSGEVLALVSYPSFDPNAFSQPAQTRGAARFFQDEQKPIFNRATDGTYPPGSIIKPLIAAGALEEKIITPQTTVLSTGGISVGPWRFADWKAGGHGVTDVKKAIAESVNTFFYLISGGDEQRTGLGVEAINKYLRAFGWAQPTQIDLPDEAAGFLPTPQWKQDVKHEQWYIGDTYHLGIGQGDVLVTPLQVAVATGALANGQYLFTPYIVEQASPPQQLPISPANIQIVKEGLRQAVIDGSGRSLSALPVPVAGKTGTAQIGGTDDTHAWFTSYGPTGNPELVVTVLLERGGSGDADAVPIAKEIWQWWVKNANSIIDK